MGEVKYLDKDEFTERGKNVYKLLKPKLEKKFKGKVIAIEVDSGDYVIGNDEVDVLKTTSHNKSFFLKQDNFERKE